MWKLKGTWLCRLAAREAESRILKPAIRRPEGATHAHAQDPNPALLFVAQASACGNEACEHVMAVSAGGSMVGGVAQRLSQQSFETWEEVELEDER